MQTPSIMESGVALPALWTQARMLCLIVAGEEEEKEEKKKIEKIEWNRT